MFIFYIEHVIFKQHGKLQYNECLFSSTKNKNGILWKMEFDFFFLTTVLNRDSLFWFFFCL